LNAVIITVLVVVSLAMALGVSGGMSMGFDRDRVRVYFVSRNERLLSIRWDPWHFQFGHRAYGWGPWGRSDHGSYYRVRFIDREGHEHAAVCYVYSIAGAQGIDLQDDRIVRYVDDPDHPSPAQEAENRLLRSEADDLARTRPGQHEGESMEDRLLREEAERLNRKRGTTGNEG
jgi:hypothetical protein